MRLRMTEKQYTEMVESLRWCQEKGMTALATWYEEMLEFQARRRALPVGRQRDYEDRHDEEKRDAGK